MQNERFSRAQVAEYIKRLGMEPPDAISLGYLDQLILAHQKNIVFENLDICDLKKEISLDLQALFDKIIRQERGGYCFELNKLFTCLLNSLGYFSYPCMCIVVEEDVEPMISHRGVMVVWENENYFCDVGFGGPAPPGWIRVQNRSTRTIHNETYLLEKEDDIWWTLKRLDSRGNWTGVVNFQTIPQAEIDFEPLNYYFSTHPDSEFVQYRMLNIRTETGYCSLTDHKFSENAGGKKRTLHLESEDEIREVMENYFLRKNRS